jgi:hypothetical protein
MLVLVAVVGDKTDLRSESSAVPQEALIVAPALMVVAFILSAGGPP